MKPSSKRLDQHLDAGQPQPVQHAAASSPRAFDHNSYHLAGSVAEWLACWTQAQNGLDSNRSRDAVG